MTKLTNGPAAGVCLALKRSPVFLRVVHDRITHVWDALDLVDDAPRDPEDAYAYYRISLRGRVHLNFGRGRGGGFYARAEYALVDPQPGDDVMRSNDKWRDWATFQRWAKGEAFENHH